jgi:outer membrane protein
MAEDIASYHRYQYFCGMRLALIGLLGMIASSTANAQTGTWTLEQCIEQGLKSNIDVQLAAISAKQAAQNFRSSLAAATPDANINAGQFFQSGRSIDRFTNQFVQSTVSSNNFQLQSSVLLYAGGQIRNGIQQSKYLWLAGESDFKNMEQNTALNIANLFLQIIQAKELKSSAEETLKNTESQLQRTRKLFDAGVVNEGQVLNLEAQKANDQTALTNAANQEILALSNLKMTLRLPAENAFDIIRPEISMFRPESYGASQQELFDSAVKRRPDVQSAVFRHKAAIYARKSARGGMLPVLSVGGNLSTVYSSNAKSVSAMTISGFEPIGRVQGTNDIVEAPNIQYTLQTIDFNKQIKDNFGQSLGFNLSVPVYGKLQARNTAQRASLDETRAKLSAERAVQNLYSEVVSAHNNFTSAMERYQAAIRAMDAQKRNMEFVRKRFDAGQANVFELQLAQTNETTARNNLTSVRYEYMFRKMVLDFYLGKPLTL